MARRPSSDSRKRQSSKLSWKRFSVRAAAEGEPAFAGGCGYRDKEEKVGVDLPATVNAKDFGEAAGEADDGAEKKNIGIFVGVGLADDGFKEVGEVAIEFQGEGGHWFRDGRFHQSVISIGPIS